MFWRTLLRVVVLLATPVLLVGPARAAKVVVFESMGDKSVTKILTQALGRKLENHQVVAVKRAAGLKSVGAGKAGVVAKAVRKAGAAVGVASLVSGRRNNRKLSILAVAAEGVVLVDRSVKLPRRKPDAKLKQVSRDAAKKIGRFLEPAPAPAPATAPSIASTSTGTSTSTSTSAATSDSELGSESGPTSGPWSSLAEDDPWDGGSDGQPSRADHLLEGGEPKVETQEAKESHRKRSWHAAASIAYGGTGYTDRITSATKAANLRIGVPFTSIFGLALEGGYEEIIVASVNLRRWTATMALEDAKAGDITVRPNKIDASLLGITGSLGTRLNLGFILGGAHLAVSYDSHTTADQVVRDASGTAVDIVVVPSWKRLQLMVGVDGTLEDVALPGLHAQVGIRVVPWGAHSESPYTSGSSSYVWGGQGWLRARYHLADLGGPFLGLEASGEYVRIQYRGPGTRVAVGTGDRVGGHGDAREARLSWSSLLSAGYRY